LTSIAENIKTTDRNAYIPNKNTPDTAIIDTSSQYVKEMRKLRCTTFQSKLQLRKLKTQSKPINTTCHNTLFIYKNSIFCKGDSTL